jgi:phosphoglycolate phosphatase-like HAD superfamily hydrolase
VARLVLWDIDGTLLHGGETAAAVFDRALEAVLGVRPSSRPSMSGKTDPQILLDYLDLLGLDPAGVDLEAVLARLADELAAAQAELRAGGRVLPGVREALATLAARPGWHQSVLTGNLARNARLKLETFGLLPFVDLDIGAFGSDRPRRTALLPVALDRLRRRHGVALDPSAVWVIGDTPFDLAVARAHGARALLVGTGRFPPAALAALGPDAVRCDLQDTEGLLELLAA